MVKRMGSGAKLPDFKFQLLPLINCCFGARKCAVLISLPINGDNTDHLPHRAAVRINIFKAFRAEPGPE